VDQSLRKFSAFRDTIDNKLDRRFLISQQIDKPQTALTFA
jgi:hypothetical protein